MSEGLEIQGQRRRLLCRNGGPEELATTTEVSEEEYKTKVSTKTTEASIEEAEDTTHPSERLRRRRHWCVYRQPEVLTTTPEASIDKSEYTTHLSERLQPRRRRCVYGIRVLTTTTLSSTN